MNPIIIIGAARSGTNMLRDIICKLDDFATWDCDEINPIWRHGNLSHPNDRFTKEMETPAIHEFIKKSFDKIARSYKVTNVVEKSCANSLRVGFINQVLPTSKFVFIYRDGRDTVASSKLRWKSKFDLKYTLKKLRYVPISDLPYYAYRFGFNRIKRLITRKENLGFWGVHVPDLEDYVKEKSIEEVCAYQWKECIDHSLSDFEHIHDSRIHKVKYEDFVQNPEKGMKSICTFLGVSTKGVDFGSLTNNISSKSIGKYKEQLKAHQIEEVEKLIGGTLTKLGY